MKTLISIDWLQMWGHLSGKEDFNGYHYGTEVSHSRIFSEIRNIYKGTRIVGSICMKPYSHILKPNAAQLRIANDVLYDEQRNLIVSQIMSFCGFVFHNFTRVDIALDLQYFRNGLYVEDFIKGFLKGKYLKNKNSHFSTFGYSADKLTFTGITFGKRGGRVFTRLYNKTKEMEEQTNKEYIKQAWQGVGFDMSKDVWRLEFEIRGKDAEFVDVSTGDYYKLVMDILDNSVMLDALLDRYILDAWDFRINDGTKNKSRMKKLDLFDVHEADYIRVCTHKYRKGGLRERILLKNLTQYVERYGTKSLQMSFNIEELKEHLVQTCGLWSYQEKKEEIWQLEMSK